MRSSLGGQPEVPWTVNSENPKSCQSQMLSRARHPKLQGTSAAPSSAILSSLFPSWLWRPPRAKVITPRAFLSAGQCLGYWSHWNYPDFRAGHEKVTMRNSSLFLIAEGCSFSYEDLHLPSVKSRNKGVSKVSHVVWISFPPQNQLTLLLASTFSYHNESQLFLYLPLNTFHRGN